MLTPPGSDPHDPPQHVRAVTKAARQAAIDRALTMATAHDVYVIHSMPGPTLIAQYQAAGAQLVTIDPGRATVLARCKAERPWQMHQAAKRWYDEQAAAAASKQADQPSKHEQVVMQW